MSGSNHETPPMLEDSTYSYVTCPNCGHKINDITPNVFYRGDAKHLYTLFSAVKPEKLLSN